MLLAVDLLRPTAAVLKEVAGLELKVRRAAGVHRRLLRPAPG